MIIKLCYDPASIIFCAIDSRYNNYCSMCCHEPKSSNEPGKGQMRLTSVSGDRRPQQVWYRDEKSATSNVTTFTRNDMCSGILKSPTKNFGWRDTGYIHTTKMSELQQSQSLLVQVLK